MSLPDATPWPTDSNELARIAADAQRDLPLREQAFKALRPIIRRVVSRVSARFHGQARDDLLEAGEGDVWLALPTLPKDVGFERWCYGVVHNRQIDRLREEQAQQRRARAVAEAPVAAEDVALRVALERGLDQPGRLAEEDLEQVRSWPPAPRLALLSLTGLWSRVPGGEWQTWAGRYRATECPALPDPFPPEELEGRERLAERNGLLPEALQVPRNTLSVWLHRYKPRIRQLRYVRERLEA
jgi:DNA-directed RNA polymerase specialized sigma24 family protein